MSNSNIISQMDAVKLVGDENVSFVDGSWYLPAHNRNGAEEFLAMRIPGAVYFDIDAVADPETDLPHMLPSPEQFAQAASVLGLSNDRKIIVYDGPGLFSAPRVWWTLRIMGARDVSVLEGGFDTWKANTLPVETGNPNPAMARRFVTDFEPERVAGMQLVERNISDAEAVVIDARPLARFEGRDPEPRPGLRSGHIPGSKALPFTMLLSEGKLKNPAQLDEIFNNLGIFRDTAVITTCGSGVSAAILTLALEETGRTNHRLYDGSWAEWGRPDGPGVETS